MSNNECKAIMYHYVRDGSDFIPDLKYLHVDDFRKQLDFFEKKYGFIKREDWENFIINKTEPPRGILLTFDDGLIDHYRFVLPILKEKKLWGIFFVCSAPLKEKTVLDVHKIHYLLGKYSSKDIYEKLKNILEKLNVIGSLAELINIDAYKKQTMDEYSRIIKKINYLSDRNIKKDILDELMRCFYQSNDLIWNDIYMDTDQIKELKNAGNIIGGHSEKHFVLSQLNKSELDEEIEESNEILNQILKIKINSFCYPYGGVNSYNIETKNKLKEINIKYAFCVNPRDIIGSDMLLNNYELPRYDCNLFEYGKVKFGKKLSLKN